MRLTFLIIFKLFISSIVFSNTIYVPLDYPSIQEAIDASASGDTVIVSPGTYYENINFIGKAIYLKSACGPSLTTIDGNKSGSVVVFYNYEDCNSILDGFSITNGSGHGFYKLGGGIYCENSSPVICNNIIVSNNANIGGGVHCQFKKCKAIIENCSIIYNCASKVNNLGEGGGITCWDMASPIVQNNIISNNVCDLYGGGICCRSGTKPTIRNNIISSNNTDFQGGGLFIDNSSYVIVENNNICNNKSRDGGGLVVWDGLIINNTIMYNIAESDWNNYKIGYGGGMCVNGSDIIVDGNYISQNLAMTQGGGIYWVSLEGSCTNNIICNNKASGGTVPNEIISGGGVCVLFSRDFKSHFINCLINDNSADQCGGGLYLFAESKINIINCTVVNNTSLQGGAVYGLDTSTIESINSIYWNNTFNQFYFEQNQPSITYSDIENGWPGVGNFNMDPLFAGPSVFDYHLTYQSPCINVGDNAALSLPVKDIECDPRIAFNFVDVGCDEFYNHLYYVGNASPNQKVVGKLIGLPGSAPVGLFFGEDYVDPPINTMWGDFYLKSPLILILLPPIPFNGILEIPSTLPNLPAAPYDIPMQALIGLNQNSLTNLCVLEVR